MTALLPSVLAPSPLWMPLWPLGPLASCRLPGGHHAVDTSLPLGAPRVQKTAGRVRPSLSRCPDRASGKHS